MATRTYPLWKPGAPQLRIFLPNFFMKMLKPDDNAPPNLLYFKVDIKMSDLDVKNYLTKIYGAPVVAVRTTVKRGKEFKHPANGADLREPDYRMAFVTLEKNAKFVFPELFPDVAKKDLEKEKAQYDDSLQKMRLEQQKHWDRAGAPTWFGI